MGDKKMKTKPDFFSHLLVQHFLVDVFQWSFVDRRVR